MENPERISFEDALKKLESIVAQLEDESITLEKSVSLYEEGIQLSRFCTEALEKAELQIQHVRAD